MMKYSIVPSTKTSENARIPIVTIAEGISMQSSDKIVTPGESTPASRDHSAVENCSVDSDSRGNNNERPSGSRSRTESGLSKASEECPPELNKTNGLADGVHMLNPDGSAELIVWHGSATAKTFHCRGWSRPGEEWGDRLGGQARRRDTNLVRCVEDSKFRTRLCNHWDMSQGTACPMRKKGKCIFAHGPVELRVKESKKNRWGKLVDAEGNNKNINHSGGEDTYGAARAIESERKQEGKWSTDKGGNMKGTSKSKRASGRNKKAS